MPCFEGEVYWHIGNDPFKYFLSFTIKIIIRVFQVKIQER